MKNKKSRVLAVLVGGALVLTMMFGASATFALDVFDSGEEIDYWDEIQAPIITSGDYGYQINTDGTITIAEYSGSDEDLVIPDEIDGYTVSEIGYQAFDYLDLYSLTIPDTVEIIEPRAFEYCTILNDLSLPEYILVQNDAFAYAYLPSVVTIPTGAILGEDSFSYNEGLELLIIEPDVTVGESAFSYGEDLKAVVCAEGSKLEDDAFEYTDSLEQAVLCGYVETDGEPFDYCYNVQVGNAKSSDFAQILDVLQNGIGGETGGTDIGVDIGGGSDFGIDDIELPEDLQAPSWFIR